MAQNGNRNKRIADYTVAFNAGLVALIFSAQFFPIQHDICTAIMLAIAGIGAMAWAGYTWKTL